MWMRLILRGGQIRFTNSGIGIVSHASVQRSDRPYMNIKLTKSKTIAAPKNGGDPGGEIPHLPKVDPA